MSLYMNPTTLLIFVAYCLICITGLSTGSKDKNDHGEGQEPGEARDGMPEADQREVGPGGEPRREEQQEEINSGSRISGTRTGPGDGGGVGPVGSIVSGAFCSFCQENMNSDDCKRVCE